MNTTLIIGTLLAVGFALGEIAKKFGLPRVTGYIVAGVLLNPEILHIIPSEFVHATEPITHIALTVLTFAVGGTLAFAPLKELGKGIAFISVGEVGMAVLAVTLSCLVILPFIIPMEGAGFISTYLPLALLFGALASPTDPAVVLSIIRQYKAKGPVSFNVMASAAIGDAIGIVNFSVATTLAAVFITHAAIDASSFLVPALSIGGGIFLGVTFGIAFHFLSRLVHSESDGLLFILILATLTLCYGLAKGLDLAYLLATLSMGVTVVNIGRERARIFKLLQDYAEPLIFLLFFTISGLHLDLHLLLKFLPVAVLYVAFRMVGKLSGAYSGASLARASQAVRRYTGWGLIPQGGIVIGLALAVKENPALEPVSAIVLNVIIGATIIHGLIGPLIAKWALQRAGELSEPPPK